MLEGNLHFNLVHKHLDPRIFSAMNDVTATTTASTSNNTTSSSSSSLLPAAVSGHNNNDQYSSSSSSQPPPAAKKIKVVAGTSLFPKRLVQVYLVLLVLCHL